MHAESYYYAIVTHVYVHEQYNNTVHVTGSNIILDFQESAVATGQKFV